MTCRESPCGLTKTNDNRSKTRPFNSIDGMPQRMCSVLNKFNQIHSVKNVFVTDGSCMTSSGNVNPSLTYMAITARAANHAVKELKKMNL